MEDLIKEIEKLKKQIDWLLLDKFVSEMEVEDGIMQHPTDNNFETWKSKRQL